MDSIVAYKSDDEQDSDSGDKSRESIPAYKTEGDSNHKKYSKNIYDKDRNSPSTRRKAVKSDYSKRSSTDRGAETRSKDSNRRENKRHDDREKDRRHEDRSDRRGRDDRRREKDDRRYEDRQRDDRRRGDRHHYRSHEHRNRGDRDRRHWRSRSKSKERRTGSSSPPPDKRDKDRKRHAPRPNSPEKETTTVTSRGSISQYDTPNKASSRDYDRLSDNYGSTDYRNATTTTPQKDSSSSYQTSSSSSLSFAITTPATQVTGGGLLAPTPNSLDLEQKAETTAINKLLPSYYNPNIINPNKYAEQVQKRKLLWGNKKSEDTASKWGSAKFAQDTDGKVASKFMRLMGIKDKPKADGAGGGMATAAAAAATTATGGTPTAPESIKKQEEMFTSMEQQYEVARQATHTMRGVGLGFSSQPRPF